MTSKELPSINARTNQSLHCMAAHLHRYRSELRSLAHIVEDIRSYNSHLHNDFVDRGMRESSSLESIIAAIDQITSHVSGISTFRDELQQKIDNVLALVRAALLFFQVLD